MSKKPEKGRVLVEYQWKDGTTDARPLYDVMADLRREADAYRKMMATASTVEELRSLEAAANRIEERLRTDFDQMALTHHRVHKTANAAKAAVEARQAALLDALRSGGMTDDQIGAITDARKAKRVASAHIAEAYGAKDSEKLRLDLKAIKALLINK